MKINITKPFGCFHVSASCEVSEEQRDQLATLGALYLFERAPSTAVEQKVFGPMLGWEQTESGSYKRPAKFERNSVAFTQDLAAKVKAAYERTPGKLGKGEEQEAIDFTITAIVENEQGEASAMVRATLFVDSLLGDEESEKGLRMVLGLQGLEDADGASRDELIAFAHKKGLGIQPPKKKK